MDISQVLETIYRKYFNLFISIGFRYRLDKETIKDMIQETFSKVLSNTKTIRAETEPELRSYVITTFRNQCLLYLRDSKKHWNIDTYEGNSIDVRAHPLYEILIIEEIRLRDYAITLIEPEKYREPVRLYLDGLKPGRIAEIIVRNGSTTRNLIHRGLKKFEKIIFKLDPLRKG